MHRFLLAFVLLFGLACAPSSPPGFSEGGPPAPDDDDVSDDDDAVSDDDDNTDTPDGQDDDDDDVADDPCPELPSADPCCNEATAPLTSACEDATAADATCAADDVCCVGNNKIWDCTCRDLYIANGAACGQ